MMRFQKVVGHLMRQMRIHITFFKLPCLGTFRRHKGEAGPWKGRGTKEGCRGAVEWEEDQDW